MIAADADERTRVIADEHGSINRSDGDTVRLRWTYRPNLEFEKWFTGSLFLGSCFGSLVSGKLVSGIAVRPRYQVALAGQPHQTGTLTLVVANH